MAKRTVAVVGRPNVGKSTLFNALCREKISIVSDEPGVTRDRIYATCEWLDTRFTLIDTGGIEPDNGDYLKKEMVEQAFVAIESADVIIFVTDVRDGLTADDMEVAALLRRSKKPVVLCVNKVDSYEKFKDDIYEFYNLGLGDPFPVSASSMSGFGDLLDETVKHLPSTSEDDEEEGITKVAVIGKPNTGKSSLVNRLSGKKRVIVSDIAGTTRDAIDTRVKYQGKEYILIDTAGLRRKSKIKENLERYSIIRAVSAVERADVVVLMIDAGEGVTEQDAKIAGIAHEKGRGILIAVNKWDLPEKENGTAEKFAREVRRILSFIPYADIIFISAKTGQRVDRVFQKIDMIYENMNRRIATGVLNEVLSEAVAMQQPPSDKGRRLKIFYMTEVSVNPPTFVIFVNDKKLMHFSYTRYIENRLREAFEFDGVPLNFIIRVKSGEED
ncbi:MAG: ribosome biogenesis GTPase Der [Lachnospiraceae bacterium]|nr:ribosome biogenesis GTPase Der [Lachnospiraceae bacterium]